MGRHPRNAPPLCPAATSHTERKFVIRHASIDTLTIFTGFIKCRATSDLYEDCSDSRRFQVNGWISKAVSKEVVLVMVSGSECDFMDLDFVFEMNHFKNEIHSIISNDGMMLY